MLTVATRVVPRPPAPRLTAARNGKAARGVGGDHDRVAAVAASGTGEILLAASTADFYRPWHRGDKATFGDGYVVRFDADLAAPRSVTFIGGPAADGIATAAVTPLDEILIAGYSGLDDLPLSKGRRNASTCFAHCLGR